MSNYSKEIAQKLEEIDNLISFYKEKKFELDNVWCGLDNFQDRTLRGQTEKQINECINSLEKLRDKLFKLQTEMLGINGTKKLQ